MNRSRGNLSIKNQGRLNSLPLIIVANRSIVELERKLDIARRLRGRENSHSGPYRSRAAICIQVCAVESIEEIGPELKLRPLCYLEVLLQAQINVPIPGATHRSLGWAIPKTFRGGR